MRSSLWEHWDVAGLIFLNIEGSHLEVEEASEQHVNLEIHVVFFVKCCNWKVPGPKSREPGEIFGSWKSESSFSWLVSFEEFEYSPCHPVHPSKSNEQENTKARSANYTDVIVPGKGIIQNNILNIFNDFIIYLLCRMHPKLTYNQLDGILCRQFHWIQELHPGLKICCKNVLRFQDFHLHEITDRGC